jgi:integrase
MLDVHLNPAFGQRQLRELTREELQSFLSRKLSNGLSWETVHHFKCGMSKILGAAEEWGYIAENVAQKTKLPRRQRGTERIVLTPIQVRDIAAVLNEPARSVTLLLALTGLRVGELLALRWGCIDLTARMLRVCETVYDGHFDQPKTKRSARTIPIGTETAEILAAIRPAAIDAKALVFATREGLPLDRWNLLRKHLKPAAKKLGLPGVTWHLLRHSHADDARFCRNAARNDAIASRAFHAGNHARDLFARDPGRAASRSGKCRAACIWTQMDPSSAFGATGVKQSKLKTKK